MQQSFRCYIIYYIFKLPTVSLGAGVIIYIFGTESNIRVHIIYKGNGKKTNMSKR